MAADLARVLEIAGSILVTETQQETRLAVASQSGTGRVAFSAVGDTCPLCEALDGKVFRSDSAQAKRFTPPLHINCDCMWTAVGDDEVGGTDDFTSKDMRALRPAIEEHGHFVRDPEKYQALRIPAGPSGKDFTFRRRRDKATGELRSEIEWSRSRYEIEGLREGTVETGVSEVGEKWQTLDLRTLDQAETVEHIEGWARERFPRMDVQLAGGEVETLRETLGQLDELGRMYREVEDSIPSLRVLAAEEFGELSAPTAFVATRADGSMVLNALHYGDRAWFESAWREGLVAGGPELPAAEGVISHEFGEAYRMWLQRERPEMWARVESYAREHHPPELLGIRDDFPITEGVAEGFAVMHLAPRDEWPGYVDGLRPLLRYEARVDF